MYQFGVGLVKSNKDQKSDDLQDRFSLPSVKQEWRKTVRAAVNVPSISFHRL